MYELGLIGTSIGFLSGFLGVGGGMILVPILLYLGFVMKEAVSISIMQMVFSSTYGSFLNFKKARKFLTDGIIIGVGGFIGALQNGFIISNVSNEFLEYLLILILIFSIVKIFVSPTEHKDSIKNKNKFLLFAIGFTVGIISMSVGIGGSLLLAPILVGYLNYSLKEATTLGLFSLVFSSIAGFISLSYYGHMLYEEGFIVGLASLVGVYFGIKLKNIIHSESYKKVIIILNIIILIFMITKVFQ